jgi:hypothetical protein
MTLHAGDLRLGGFLSLSAISRAIRWRNMRRSLDRSEVIFLLMMVPWYTVLALYGTADMLIFLIPFWLLPPLMWYAKRRRTTKTNPDVCIRCGYSLIGNVSGVCPECGTPTGKVGSP